MPRSFRPPPADVTVLAGDIGVGLQGLRWALTAFSRPVVYVLGNHELYSQRPLVKLLDKARRKLAGTHVHLLENEAVEIGGVQFLGATLWTDFALFGAGEARDCRERAAKVMTDFSRIFVRRRGRRLLDPETGRYRRTGDVLTPGRSVELHQESRAWFEAQLHAEGARLPKVVVTHHAPTPLSLRPQDAADRLSAVYASDLSRLVEGSCAALWIHGHIHESRDYRIGATRVVSNPRGYAPHEVNPRFDSGLVVDV